MKLHGWQDNTTGEDVAAVLQHYGATNVQKHEGQEHPEFEWDSFVDEDKEILQMLAIMLWYNDRSPGDIAKIQMKVAMLLEHYPRRGT